MRERAGTGTGTGTVLSYLLAFAHARLEMGRLQVSIKANLSAFLDVVLELDAWGRFCASPSYCNDSHGGIC